MTRSSSLFSTTLAAAAILLFGSAHAADGDLVSTKNNKGIYEGHTAVGTSPSGRKFRVYYDKEGKVVYTDSKGLSQTGKWLITDDGMMCYDWVRWRDRCYSHKIDGDEYQSYRDGKTKGSRFKLAPGNVGLE